ncbi:MarR family winged helix-turn-helix transcriptional regulator [Agromyces aurantiacus]|uniref:MarR family winged helix-turn-helix transcriptional regulator n=1 Tax=Agromyces aurantiacus TaxID=165814 RepID=A0ABV9R3W9_9MICO|nr:hypothetical protein [Agromyces aurantiacus]MBM7502706.1 hypothetical protein [Agromyces aurantiacus]
MNTHDHDHDLPDPVDETPEADDLGEHDAAADAPADPTTRPLGFWLKTVDRLIDREFETAFADLGVTRRDWRLLNLLGGEARDERLLAKLDARPHRLDDLVDRGWVAGEPGAWTLTDGGRDALAALGERVAAIRSRIGGAVSSDDYATTLTTLEAMARELGWSEEAAAAWRREARSRRRGGFASRDPRPGPGFRRFGRPAFGPTGAGTDRHDGCHHPDHGRHGRAHGHGPHERHGAAEVHVHVHLDERRGRGLPHGAPHDRAQR